MGKNIPSQKQKFSQIFRCVPSARNCLIQKTLCILIHQARRANIDIISFEMCLVGLWCKHASAHLHNKNKIIPK